MPITIQTTDRSFQLSSRLQRELELLNKVTPHIIVGKKSISPYIYTAVLIKGMPLTTRKFQVSNTDILFLLPPEYPALPPIGCYLNYPWKTMGQGDHHFTQQSHYGAPFLGEEGWYWYCVGLGGGFNPNRWSNTWKPTKNPENGHNLATIFISARHVINSND